MNILYVLPTVPHPTMRGELRHYYFLRALAQRHTITLLALAKTAVSTEARDELRSWTERLVIVDATRSNPRPASTLPSRVLARVAKQIRLTRAVGEMRHSFHELIRRHRFDVVLSYEFDLYPIFKGFSGTPLVVDLCDATSLRLRNRLPFTNALEWPWRYYRFREAQLWEQRLCRLTPHVIFISNRDRDAVIGRPRSALVVPNGVDTDYWRAEEPRRPSASVVFTGVMDYPPNVDAARYLIRELTPLIQRDVPGAEIVIAGRNPAKAITDAARAACGVVVTGGVADLRPYLNRASVFAAPLRFASGMQNKILEAMAMSVPVVTTPSVADGLRLDHIEEPPVRIATSTEALAAKIVALLNDAVARQQLGVDGRRFVEGHFNWDVSAAALEDVCQRAAQGRVHLVSERAVDLQRKRRVSPSTKESLGAADTVA